MDSKTKIFEESALCLPSHLSLKIIFNDSFSLFRKEFLLQCIYVKGDYFQ